jgi:hypothetical protein
MISAKDYTTLLIKTLTATLTMGKNAIHKIFL